MVLLTLWLSILGALAAPPEYAHAPVLSAPAEAPLAVEIALSSPAEAEALRLYFRAIGEREYRSIGFSRRGERAYVATLPGAVIQPPGVEYYVASPGVDRSGSAERPVPVRVQANAGQQLQEIAPWSGGLTARGLLLPSGAGYGALGVETWLGRSPPRAPEIDALRAARGDLLVLRSATPGERMRFLGARGEAESLLLPSLSLLWGGTLGADRQGVIAGPGGGLRIGDPFGRADLAIRYAWMPRLEHSARADLSLSARAPLPGGAEITGVALGGEWSSWMTAERPTLQLRLGAAVEPRAELQLEPRLYHQAARDDDGVWGAELEVTWRRARRGAAEGAP